MRRIATWTILALALLPVAGARAQTAGAREGTVAARLAEAAAKTPGLRRLGEPFTGTLGQRGAASFEVSLPEASCYEILGVGGEGVQDLTLLVLVDGVEVAADRISGVRPAVGWCAPKPVQAVIKVAMYGGAGPFAVGVYTRSAGAAAAEVVGGGESDFVANRIRQLHAQFGMGRAAVTAVVRGNLQEGDENAFEVKVAAGRCYTVIAVANPSVKDIDVVIVDRKGAEVQRDASRAGFAVVSAPRCPRGDGQVTVRIRAASGSGQFGAQLFSE